MARSQCLLLLVSRVVYVDGFRSPRSLHHHPCAHPCTTVTRPYNVLMRDEPERPSEPAPEEDLKSDFEAGQTYGKELIARFVSPQIDDPGLPYADTLVCICGSLSVAFVALTGGIPFPDWLTPLPGVPVQGYRGLPYIFPALSHGTALAVCWLLGALAAEAFDKDAYMATWQEALRRTWRAGAFATGMLLLGTQLTTSFSLAQQGLDATLPEAEFQLLSTAFEVICDVAVQAIGLTAFRLFRWADAQPRG